jgi:putative GTP pyrophosphokinase
MQKMNNINKNGKRKYSEPEEITDIVGIRIVGYVLSDISAFATLVERYFDIDWERSIDKFKELGESKVGIRAKHYIARLREHAWKDIPEYKHFEKLYIEI